MAEGAHRVRVETVDWESLLPWLALFRSFRMAFAPAQLFLALLLVVLLYLSGLMLDAIWGPRAYPDEVDHYAAQSGADFHAWREGRDQVLTNRLKGLLAGMNVPGGSEALARAPDRYTRAFEAINAYYAAEEARTRAGTVATAETLRADLRALHDDWDLHLAGLRAIEPRGIFDTLKNAELDGFQNFMSAATVLNFGLGNFLRGLPYDTHTMFGAVRQMLVIVPGWMLRTHPLFWTLYCIVAGAIWALLGGMIARLAAVQACRGQTAGIAPAFHFVGGRYHWFVLTPLIPPLTAGVLALLLFLFGLVFFGLPVAHVLLDTVGGLLFVIPLSLGLIIALVLVMLALGFNLLYPALAVEGADGFDAISRAASYVWSRVWRLIFYNLVTVVYGGIAYMFVGLVIFLALWVAQRGVSAGADLFVAAPHGGDLAGGGRFELILKEPQVGQLAYRVEWSQLDLSAKAAAVPTLVWVDLFIGVLAAFAVSFYFTSQTWIYLLLRRSADGTDFDDLAADQAVAEHAGAAPAAAGVPAATEGTAATATPDKIEPPSS